jgi:O-Antigen ligase
MTDMLVVAALASLFLNLELIVWGVKLRPFDAIVLLMLFHLALTRGLAQRLPLGLVLCGLFFTVQATSASMLGAGNFLREAIQVGVVFVFGAHLYNSLTAEQLRRLLPPFAVLIFVVMLYNILWHLDHGYYTGWKRLDAPKMAFLFLPVLLTYFAFKHCEVPSQGTRLAALLLPCMLPILLLSGERKALLFYLICCLVYVLKTRMLIRPTGMLAIFTAGFITLASLPPLLEIPYIAKQVDSMLAPFSTAEIRIYSSGEYVSESLSNAQRVFATRVGLQMFWDNPLIGVGTNGYERIVTERFAHLPPFLVSGIHSEFLRTLVENGVVGLLAFVLPLLRTVHFAFFGGPGLGKAEWCGSLLFLAAVMILLAIEGSGTKLMVPYVMIATLPDLVRRLAAVPDPRPAYTVPRPDLRRSLYLSERQS